MCVGSSFPSRTSHNTVSDAYQAAATWGFLRVPPVHTPLIASHTHYPVWNAFSVSLLHLANVTLHRPDLQYPVFRKGFSAPLSYTSTSLRVLLGAASHFAVTHLCGPVYSASPHESSAHPPTAGAWH